MICLDWLAQLPTAPTATQLEELKSVSRRGEDVFDRLVKFGYPLDTLLSTFSAFLQVPCLDLREYQPSAEALGMLSEQQARQLGVFPLFFIGYTLFVAINDPLDLRRLGRLRSRTALMIEPVLACRHQIDEAITRHYLTQQKIAESLNHLVSDVAHSAAEVSASAGAIEADPDSPTVQFAEQLLERGIRLAASDIHLERLPDRPRLRYRIDGLLHEYPGLPDARYDEVVSRIKILSGLDITETRAPQDGRTSMVVDGHRYDLRVSTLPQIHGEGVVLRILNAGWAPQLDQLGMPGSVLKRLHQEILRPHGMVLVTGPTGSGKTTTLYAALRELVDPTRKFLSVEDPVEYVVPGVNQVQVDEAAGRTFAQCLRSFLRHDPDVAMLGEIRDLETAEIAIRAAQTGHLIFSTLHTNNALLSVTRLVDIGVPAYLVLSSLNIVLAQRLVRRLCPHCKQPAPEPARLPFGWADQVTLYEPRGCSECNKIGYRGRRGSYEMLALNSAMRDLGGSRFEPKELLQACGPEDYFSMGDAAAELLRSGETSVAEVRALLTGDLGVEI